MSHQNTKAMPTIIGITELFASLHVAKIHGMKAPHKAVLLLSIIDLVESGSIDTPFVPLSDQLIQKFNDIWNYYVGDSPYFKPDICKPYYHLQHEPFWRLIGRNKSDDALPYDQVNYTVNYLRDTYESAILDHWLFDAFQQPVIRGALRTVLISTYLTNYPNPDTHANLA